jgi:hypothetical protein
MHADVGPTGYVAKMNKKHTGVIWSPHFGNVPPHVDPTHFEAQKKEL